MKLSTSPIGLRGLTLLLPFLLTFVVTYPRWLEAREELTSSEKEESRDDEFSRSPVDGETVTQEVPQEPIQIHGFIDNIVHFEELREQPEDWLVNTTRGTFRISAALSPGVDMKIGVVGRMSHGTRDLNLVPYLPLSIRNILLPGTERYYRNRLENSLYLQEGFVTLKQDSFFIRAGRIKYSTGTGYAFNPTDLLNQKNPIDPTFEYDGIDSILVRVKATAWKKMDFLLIPSTSKPADLLVRATFGKNSWEATGQFTSVQRYRTDWASVNNRRSLDPLDSGASLGSYSQGFRWNQPSLEFRKLWPGIEFYGEAGYAFISLPTDSTPLVRGIKSHERLLIGVKPMSLSRRITLFLEYMRLGESTLGTMPFRLNDLMAFNKGVLLSTNRDNLFTEVSIPWGDTVEVQFQANIGMNISTFYLSPWLHLNLAPGMRLSVSTYSCTGSPEGAYSNVGIGGFGRIRWDF